ncbi:MAG: hypothetical protein IKY39_06520 [Clostridia bacterium]|nr:hypothetical protein [Clostridia bacterium]
MKDIEFKISFDIKSAGSGCSMRLGDVDGDGRMEIILAKPAPSTDPRYFDNQVASVTAYSIDGNMLWQVGDPSGDEKSQDIDLPIQVYDIDKDGKNEVIVVMEGNLLILDGKTAEIKKQIPLPDQYIGGTVLIADLEGTGYAQNIILKNKYSHIWALDINLNIIWDAEGNIGHSPIAYDLNGDGKDEIIAGYNVFSNKGELLWKTEYPDHAASSLVECLYKPDEPVVIIYGPVIRAYSKDGDFLWEIPESAKNIVVGKFRDNVDTLDLLVLDSMSLFDNKGNFLYQKNETIYLPTPVLNFDGQGKLLIAGHKKEDVLTTVYDGYMRGVYTLPTFGNIASGDILGEGKSQIIIYNDEIAEVYSETETDFTEPARPYSRPQSKQYYNVSIYNTVPESQISTGLVVDDFASQNIVKWASTYSSINMYNSFTKVLRSEFVLLLATLLSLKEEFTENFADVSKDEAYYDAVGTFKALGVLYSEDNLFSPDAPITVASANDILDRLSIPINFNFDERYELSKQDMAKLIISITTTE